MIIVELAVFYFMSQEIIFYYASMGVFGITIIYTFQMIKDFQHFQNIFDQNISNLKQNVELNTPLAMEAEGLPLKACLLYRNSHSFTYVSKALGLNHSELARRQVIKGLDALLKEHNEKKVVAAC